MAPSPNPLVAASGLLGPSQSPATPHVPPRFPSDHLPAGLGLARRRQTELPAPPSPPSSSPPVTLASPHAAAWPLLNNRPPLSSTPQPPAASPMLVRLSHLPNPSHLRPAPCAATPRAMAAPFISKLRRPQPLGSSQEEGPWSSTPARSPPPPRVFPYAGHRPQLRDPAPPLVLLPVRPVVLGVSAVLPHAATTRSPPRRRWSSTPPSLSSRLFRLPGPDGPVSATVAAISLDPSRAVAPVAPSPGQHVPSTTPSSSSSTSTLLWCRGRLRGRRARCRHHRLRLHRDALISLPLQRQPGFFLFAALMLAA